jgi:hypothetical protein
LLERDPGRTAVSSPDGTLTFFELRITLRATSIDRATVAVAAP